MAPKLSISGTKASTSGKVLGGVSMSQYMGNLRGAFPKMNAKGGFSGSDKPGFGRG